jgi:glycosyltransferase involved in cell wall biosynthesis
MRIIIPYPIPDTKKDVISGAGRYLYELKRGAKKHKRVDFISISSNDFSQALKVIYANPVSPHSALKRRFGLPHAFALILGTIKDAIKQTKQYRNCTYRKDAIFHAQRVGCEYQTIAARLAGFKHVITTVHNLPGEDRAARHWFKRIIEWLSFKCASHHICVSQATFDAWHERIGLKREKCTVIYNGMTPPDYSNFDRDAYRAKLGLTPDTVAIGICARLHYMKGHEILLKAFSKLLDEQRSGFRVASSEFSVASTESAVISIRQPPPNSEPRTPNSELHLLIAGTGPEEDKLKRLTAELGLTEHVTFLGHRTDAVQFAKALDINVLPSVTLETLGYSLIEAMFAGVPSVVSNVGGMKELIYASGGGKIVPANDVKQLATELKSYIDAPDERTRDGAEAQRYALQYLTSEKMADVTLQVYNSSTFRE